MSAPTTTRQTANEEPAARQGPAPRPRRERKWWRSGTLWIGVLGTVLGAAGTLGVNEAVAALFPRTDRASRLADAVQGLADELRAGRDGVARLASQLREQEPGSPDAAETARQLEAAADRLVRTSDSLAALAEGSAHASPASSPAEAPAGPATAAPPAARSASEVADSAPEADLWLPSHHSTMIGASRNSFGVRYWGTGINIGTDQITVGLNGEATTLRAGDRLQFPDPANDCFIIYLRTIDPDPAKEGDERHGFALTCAPRQPGARP